MSWGIDLSVLLMEHEARKAKIKMAGLLNHLALVTESSRVSFESLSIVSAALQKQIARDFGPIWGVNATIDAFPRLEDAPLDYWKVLVMDDIGDDGAAGFHQAP